jgi:hypothetical protein
MTLMRSPKAARVVRRPYAAHLALVFQVVERVEPPLEGDEVVDLV